MCGIAGILTARPDLDLTAILARMQRAIAHRGPDDAGAEVVDLPGGRRLGLGHHRLSILDLTASGHQPMAHVASGCQIVFNGEIYNFRRLRNELEHEGDAFRSGSDTEVLLAGLARHGETFLDRLEGMYAFAFFDPHRCSLLLARDPAGIKPLYHAQTSEGLVFASEVRALLATGLIPPKLDRRGVAGFLAYGAVQHPSTSFEGVASLPAGTSLTLCAGYETGPLTESRRRFWQFPRSNDDWTADSATATVRETLDRAVRDHLVADVPVGIFLSSGIDSTILAGLAGKHSPDVRSFTVTFDDHPDFSEKHLAAESARAFGLHHTEIPLPSDAAESAVVDWLAALDQPSIDGLNVFVISRAVNDQGMKVALSGLGADELFGGYPSFRESPRLWKLARFARPIPSGVRRGLANAATVGRSAAVRFKLQDMLEGQGTLRSSCLRRRRVLSDQQLARLGLTAGFLGLDRDFLAPDALPDLDAVERDPVRVVSQVECRSYQGNTLLRDADANGMAFGLEIRVPFLDQRLMNLVHGIPGRIRLPMGAPGKQLLRSAFPDLLRPEILFQPKRGFALPVSRWMTGSLRPVCERSLSTLSDAKIVEPDGVQAVWKAFLKEPESPMWSRAFALVVLGEFCRKSGATG
ncbi:MAG: asparagine synthase (glutamine-hydrolyzing) [Planctomycetaceae bacterium]